MDSPRCRNRVACSSIVSQLHLEHQLLIGTAVFWGAASFSISCILVPIKLIVLTQMKTKNKFFIILLLVGISLSSYAREHIRIATGEWSPYTSAELKYKGLVSRIITEAFALEGVQTEYEFFPWGRALLEAKKGTLDASSVWYYHVDREKDFLHSDPIIVMTEVFFHLKSFDFNWRDWSDLKGLRVGGTIEYTVSKMLQENQAMGGYSLEVIPTDENNFRKLLKGRIDIFASAKQVAYPLLNEKFTEEERKRLTYHPTPVHSGELYLLFSKSKPESKQTLDLFNRGLKRLKESGQYDKIIRESKSEALDK